MQIKLKFKQYKYAINAMRINYMLNCINIQTMFMIILYYIKYEAKKIAKY